MTKTLQTKQSDGGMDHYGEGTGYTAPYKLYRFIDADQLLSEQRSVCWYGTIEAAEKSWQRRHQVTA